MSFCQRWFFAFCFGMLFERLCNWLAPTFRRAYMRMMEEAYSTNTVDKRAPLVEMCTCGELIEQAYHWSNTYWRKVGTGEVCVDNHWHSPKE